MLELSPLSTIYDLIYCTQNLADKASNLGYALEYITFEN